MSKQSSLSDVDRIAGMTDPVQRNLMITSSYYALSTEVCSRTGRCANWCTFATWASRQAGRSIRKEDLLNALESHLEAPEIAEPIYDIARSAYEAGAEIDRTAIVRLLWDTVDPGAAMERASAAVARGNRKVYMEIAREFARFLETFGRDETYDASRIAAFCDTLKPGDPPEGQRYLRQAFQRYYAAFFETDKKTKAEQILLANIEIGFHEQTRLQPEIAEALEAAVIDRQVLKEKLLALIFPRQTPWSRLVRVIGDLLGRANPLDAAGERLTDGLKHRIRLFLTANMMEIAFPNHLHLKLGRDLTAGFPSDLQQLSNPDLLDMLQRIDPTKDSLRDSAALDWADLHDRLHFIADMFRCYQEREELLSMPDHL